MLYIGLDADPFEFLKAWEKTGVVPTTASRISNSAYQREVYRTLETLTDDEKIHWDTKDEFEHHYHTDDERDGL